MAHLHDLNIGFIGLGLMGKPMACNLKKAGANVVVFNRSQPAVEELRSKGFQSAPSPAELATVCDLVICMVSDTAAVQSVLFDDQGVAAGIRAGAIVIDMGTTEVQATRQFADQLQALQAGFVDAPVSGGEIGAIEGTLSIMVGACEHDLNRVSPVLQILGSQLVHIGEVGCGQIAKAANQSIVGLTIGAVAEGFGRAEGGGADLEQVWKALRGGLADSKIMALQGRRMLKGNYQPGGTAKTQRKDLRQALDFAQTIDLDLPSTDIGYQRYNELIEQGDGNLDHSALFRLYKR